MMADVSLRIGRHGEAVAEQNDHVLNADIDQRRLSFVRSADGP